MRVLTAAYPGWMATALGDFGIAALLFGAAWVIMRVGSPMALPRRVVRSVMPSRFSDETYGRVSRFQDRSLAIAIAFLGFVFVVGGLVNLGRAAF